MLHGVSPRSWALERLVISVTPEQREWLEEAAHARRVSVALIIRELIEAARCKDTRRGKTSA
jgi:hypothetical protein